MISRNPNPEADSQPTLLSMKVSVFADVDSKCLRGFAKKFDAGRKVFVGNGVVELSREDLFKGGGEVKSGVAVRMTEPAFDCPSLNEAAADGSFMLQVCCWLTQDVADQ